MSSDWYIKIVNSKILILLWYFAYFHMDYYFACLIYTYLWSSDGNYSLINVFLPKKSFAFFSCIYFLKKREPFKCYAIMDVQEMSKSKTAMDESRATSLYVYPNWKSCKKKWNCLREVKKMKASQQKTEKFDRSRTRTRDGRNKATFIASFKVDWKKKWTWKNGKCYSMNSDTKWERTKQKKILKIYE